MNLLEEFAKHVLSILSFRDYKDESTKPGWAGRTPRMRKSRTPFQGRAKRYGTQHMQVETFRSKEKRDERFRQLRYEGVKHVSKFSDWQHGHDIWCVVRP